MPYCVKLPMLLLLFISTFLYAEDDPDFRAAAKCQQALLSRKVANGEFPESILEKALMLPPEPVASEKEEKNIKRLFERLGAGKYEDREAATVELAEKYNAPGSLRILLGRTRDPEVIGRARKIIKGWKDKSSDDGFSLKFKMWMNCPSCMAKLKMYPDIYALAQKNSRNQLMYGAVNGICLDDFPPNDRISAVVFWMDSFKDRTRDMRFPFFRQLKEEEWRNGKFFEALRNALGNEDSGFDGIVFEDLLWSIPEDIDLKSWLPMLASADKRKGAIAALLVKAGNREALPAFIDLLAEEWTTLNEKDGRINGGGHSMFFSPFHQFEILEIPAYRRFAPEILKGIESKFSDDRITIHNVYFNAVKPFAGTEAGLKLLDKASTHKCPQTAITACLMLYRQNGKDEVLERLLNALNAAGPQDVMNNHSELAGVIRILRGRMLLEPGKSAFYRKFIQDAVSVSLKNILVARQDYLQSTALDFFCNELELFDLVALERQKIIETLAGREQFEWWAYPESAVRFLVDDSSRKGDMEELLEKLRERALAPDAKLGEEVLFAEFAMISGRLSSVGQMKDKLKKLLEKNGDKDKCPPQISKLAWIVYPEMLLESPQPFDWGPNYLLIRGANCDYGKIAAKIDKQGKGYKAQLFRLSYGLEGADLALFNEIKESDGFNALSEMAWKNPPAETAIRDKVNDLCVRMMDMENDWEIREFVKNMPGLASRFGIKMDELKTDNPIVLRIAVETAFRNCDRRGYEAALGKLMKNPEFYMTENIRVDIGWQKMILDFSEGLTDDRDVRMFSRKNSLNSDVYKFVNILYENGFPEKARDLRRLIPVPEVYFWWDCSESCLSWAWNEAVSGNNEEAVMLSETALLNARSKGVSDYTIMMRRLLKGNSEEFREFLEVLALKKDFSKRTDYADAIAKFAGKAVDKDLKALSAFMAARLSLALGRTDGEVRKLWSIGAEAGGLLSVYCSDAMNSVPEGQKRFTVSSGWYSRDQMPEKMNPFTHGVGICYKADKPYLLVKESEWIGPYGIPVSKEKLQYFCDGTGWWNYIREQSRAWVPGEWSIIVRHHDGVEYYQRSLLPFGKTDSQK
ncbi:MAG TPA: hypothetical protein DET40_07450 [Lentisphaeria bacterium]|nr:MAG: hypothetical protein A2X45_06850 [Lentisphaerae bacterium GWF2_50_93]HCE43367.1 hypothetical protein [Lentisphaeria bacterium]